MSKGLATTFRVLGKTENEAAVRVLIPALDSPNEAIRDGAFETLLARRSTAGAREIVKRLHTLPPQWRERISERRERLSRAIRDGILGTDRQTCHNACEMAVWLREYDQIPTLLSVLEGQTAENAELATSTLLELTGALYEALSGSGDPTDRRDPRLTRRHVLAALEASVGRFLQHERREVLDAFLQLAGRDNATLRRILEDSHNPRFLPIVNSLSNSTHPAIIRLLLSFLDDSRAPSAVLRVAGKRSDTDFVLQFLRKIGREPSLVVSQNLKRMKSIGWLKLGGECLDRLDDAAQHAAVRLAMTADIARADAFSVIDHLLLRGKPGGRREAAKALAEFQGADANRLALIALDDPDPQVQANIIAQLRRRGIPGVLPRLVGMVDVPHGVVRKAVREALDEFTFDRFIGAFDMLDERVRRGTGSLVKRIDPNTLPRLEAELMSPSHTRRLRGLAVAQSLEMVEPLETMIIDLTRDTDHLVRAEAAAALALGTSQASHDALEIALHDRNAPVREAARNALNRRAQVAKIP